jgi:hypothetical protein
MGDAITANDVLTLAAKYKHANAAYVAAFREASARLRSSSKDRSKDPAAVLMRSGGMKKYAPECHELMRQSCDTQTALLEGVARWDGVR